MYIDIKCFEGIEAQNNDLNVLYAYYTLFFGVFFFIK